LMDTVEYASTLPIARASTGTFFGVTVATLTGTGEACGFPSGCFEQANMRNRTDKRKKDFAVVKNQGHENAWCLIMLFIFSLLP